MSGLADEGFCPVRPQELEASIGAPLPEAKDDQPPMVRRGFLVSSLLIVALVLNEHLRPDDSPHMLDD